MGRTIGFTRPATRALSRMPANMEALIRDKLRLLSEDPGALANNVKALKGIEGYRLSVGDWRVIFTIEADRIIVHDVGVHDVSPCGSIYG